MYKVIGKARFTVNYQGKQYAKVRYTLEREWPKSCNQFKGICAETITLRYTEANDIPAVGDQVDVYYNKFGNIDVIIKK